MEWVRSRLPLLILVVVVLVTLAVAVPVGQKDEEAPLEEPSETCPRGVAGGGGALPLVGCGPPPLPR